MLAAPMGHPAPWHGSVADCSRRHCRALVNSRHLRVSNCFICILKQTLHFPFLPGEAKALSLNFIIIVIRVCFVYFPLIIVYLCIVIYDYSYDTRYTTFSYIVYTTLVWVLRLSRVISQSEAPPVVPENHRRCRTEGAGKLPISASSMGNAQTVLDAAGKRRFGRKSARTSLMSLLPLLTSCIWQSSH